MRWRGTTAAASLRTATSASASPPAAPPLTRLTTTHHASAGAARLPSRQAARSGRAAHGLARGRLCWADGDVGRRARRRCAAVTRIGPWSRCRWDPAEERRSRDGPAAPRVRRRAPCVCGRAGSRRRGLRSAQPQPGRGERARAPPRASRPRRSSRAPGAGSRQRGPRTAAGECAPRQPAARCRCGAASQDGH